jgi:prephenate dehydrogenase
MKTVLPTPPKTAWPTVAIVGVGLIGGSVGLAVQARRLAGRVIGVGRSATSLSAARKARAVTETSLDLEAAAAAADLVVVATAVGMIPGLLDRIDAAVRPGTLITDAGSTKARIVAAWEKRRRSRRGRFVGGHPIAGSHRRGPAAADALLFDGRVTVVTPARSTPPADAEAIGSFWAALGSTVFMMPPKEHDKHLAATSHAPHLVAAAIALATPSSARRFTAGGWRDTTRIAAGDPALWADILLDNAAHVIGAVAKITDTAGKMAAAIEAGDRRRLVTLLERAKEERDAVGG